jgi:hypothetical protein
MFTVLYTAVLTLIIMILLHHLYNYLKANLTIPKVYDAIHINQDKYNEINKSLDPQNDPTLYLKKFKKTNINTTPL